MRIQVCTNEGPNTRGPKLTKLQREKTLKMFPLEPTRMYMYSHNLHVTLVIQIYSNKGPGVHGFQALVLQFELDFNF